VLEVPHPGFQDVAHVPPPRAGMLVRSRTGSNGIRPGRVRLPPLVLPPAVDPGRGIGPTVGASALDGKRRRLSEWTPLHPARPAGRCPSPPPRPESDLHLSGASEPGRRPRSSALGATRARARGFHPHSPRHIVGSPVRASPHHRSASHVRRTGPETVIEVRKDGYLRVRGLEHFRNSPSGNGAVDRSRWRPRGGNHRGDRALSVRRSPSRTPRATT
jgi:hypothetical protein